MSAVPRIRTLLLLGLLGTLCGCHYFEHEITDIATLVPPREKPQPQPGAPRPAAAVESAPRRDTIQLGSGAQIAVPPARPGFTIAPGDAVSLNLVDTAIPTVARTVLDYFMLGKVPAGMDQPSPVDDSINEEEEGD